MISFLISPLPVIYYLRHKKQEWYFRTKFFRCQKTFGTDIASIFFSYFPHKWRTQIKIDWVLPFFYPNSKLTRNIVGGTSNIPKRYPNIINAHANKKIRVKVLVISNFQGSELSFFFFINKYILWRFIDIDSKSASAVISNQIPFIYLSVRLIFFIVVSTLYNTLHIFKT